MTEACLPGDKWMPWHRQDHRLGRPGASAVLAATFVLALPTTALANEVDAALSCPQRFHARLASHVLPKAVETRTVADALRALRPAGMPGYWLFWDGSNVAARNAHQERLLATPIVDRNTNRMCTRSILARGGRIRCLKWKPIPEGYEPPAEPAPTAPERPKISAAERHIAAGLSRRVTLKGAFHELEFGTALYHLVQRTSDELRIYASQPYRETICSGAREMVGFYRRQLQPLFETSRKNALLKSATWKTALATTKAALGKLAKTLPATLSYKQLLRALLAHAAAGDEARTPKAADLPAFTLLQQAKSMVNDDRLRTMPKQQSAALLRALRSIEFGLYAEHTEHHSRRLGASFQSALDTVTKAHAETCTCDGS